MLQVIENLSMFGLVHDKGTMLQVIENLSMFGLVHDKGYYASSD